MNSRSQLLLGFPLLLLLLTACQEAEGPCPEVESVSPESGGALDEVEITGRNFSLGHQDLWGDGASAVPPTVRLDLSLSEDLAALIPEEDLEAMEAMEMSLQADQVVFESSDRLRVTLPDLTWSDIESSASMSGVEIPEIPDIVTQIPFDALVRVINPTGCEGAYDGEFSFVLPIEQSEEETEGGGE